MTQQAEEMEIASKALGRSVKPSESAAYWFRRGLEFVREEPGAFAKLIGKKMIWSVHNTEARCSFNIYLERRLVPVLRLLGLPFSILGGIGLYGWICARRRRIPGESVLGIYVVSVFLSLIIFSVSSRYRVPAVPVMAVYAGFGLVHLAHIVRTLDVRGMVLPAVCLLGTHLISLIPYPMLTITPSGYNNIGVALARQNRFEEAITYYRLALRTKPDYAAAYNNLGVAFMSLGKFTEAERYFRNAVRLRPRDVSFRIGLADALARQGKVEAALAEYKTAVRLRPDSPGVRLVLGRFLIERGHTKEAVVHFAAIARLRPDDPLAHFNLGTLLGQLGRTDDEIKCYRRALALSPQMGEAHANLAIALYAKGLYNEAWQEVGLARRCGAKLNPDFIRALSRRMPPPQ